MKKIFYFIALVAISLFFVQCEQQSFMPKEEGTGVEVGHAYVDLGLPSGLKWAMCNVGANVSTDFGDYFAWGEVEPKKDYSWDTYKYGKKDRLTKYNGRDNKTTLDPEDDAAYVNWGGAWRMPTKEEMKELVENCTIVYTLNADANGCAVFGYKVTGPNGNSIFLPAAGYISDGLLWAGSRICFWSSSLDTSDSNDYNNAHGFDSEWGDFGSDYGSYRRLGQSVRPVCP